MQRFKKISTAIALLALSTVIGVAAVRADSVVALPVAAYDYSFTTGTLSTSFATISLSITNNVPRIILSDPKPPDPHNGATFFGTAKPEHICLTDDVTANTACDTVVFTQSECTGPQTGGGPPGCNQAAGTLNFGGFAMYTIKGDTLDQVTNLATNYYIPSPGSCGGGSPRWTFTMVNSAGNFAGDIWAYFGSTPIQDGNCASNTWSNPDSGMNFATDAAGFRWDSSQICPGTQINDYSGAVACANTNGLTIANVFLVTDGGWDTAAAPPPAQTQTVYFQNIQVNSVTRFP